MIKINKVEFKLRFLERKANGALEDPTQHLSLEVLKLMLRDFKVKTNKREEVALTTNLEYAVIKGVWGGVVNLSFKINGELLDHKEKITAVTKLVIHNVVDEGISLSDIYAIELVTDNNENVSLYPTSYSGTINNDIRNWYTYETDIDIIKCASIMCEYHYLVPTLDPTSETCKFCESMCWSDGVLNYPISTDEQYHMCGAKYSDKRYITIVGKEEDHLVSLTSVDDESIKVLNHLNKDGLKFDPDKSTIWLGTNTTSKIHSDNVKVDSLTLQLTYGGAFVKSLHIDVKDVEE